MRNGRRAATQRRQHQRPRTRALDGRRSSGVQQLLRHDVVRGRLHHVLRHFRQFWTVKRKIRHDNGDKLRACVKLQRILITHFAIERPRSDHLASCSLDDRVVRCMASHSHNDDLVQVVWIHVHTTTALSNT
ncbi:hypothetical protein LSAT2_008063 [Lamellibrachia satsuma]|nr:hypothetical protein LSAT2_008063 [Lamellibrachia satsuma]